MLKKIVIKGAKEHNLKNVSLEIPKEKLEKISFKSALTRRDIGGKPGKHTKTALRRTVVIFDDFKVGDSVEHAIFGIGKVMAISGQGENQELELSLKMA